MAGAREKIKLVSTGKTADGKPTGVYYTTTKNKRNGNEKLQMKKFDWRIRQHVVFKEDKIK